MDNLNSPNNNSVVCVPTDIVVGLIPSPKMIDIDIVIPIEPNPMDRDSVIKNLIREVEKSIK